MSRAASSFMSRFAVRLRATYKRFATMVAMLCVACARREPPAPPGSSSVALPDLHPLPDAAPPHAVAPVAAIDAAPGALPQTRESPRTDAAFTSRVSSLWLAIVQDDPQMAAPFFFPESAYQQVKDITNPSADWKHRLLAAYMRDIHGLHARLGRDLERVQLIELTVPQDRARWVEPGEEYNKIGYYRVFGSRLRYRDAVGSEQAFEVKSLISWRGEWYVVHLSATK